MSHIHTRDSKESKAVWDMCHQGGHCGIVQKTFCWPYHSRFISKPHAHTSPIRIVCVRISTLHL